MFLIQKKIDEQKWCFLKKNYLRICDTELFYWLKIKYMFDFHLLLQVHLQKNSIHISLHNYDLRNQCIHF